jgi:hypothetical protein
MAFLTIACTSLIAQGLEQEFACSHGYLFADSKNTIFDPVNITYESRLIHHDPNANTISTHN